MALVSSMMSPAFSHQYEEYSQRAQPPRPPPSPPMDEFKCSLPSISNLLGLADAGSPSSETSSMSRRTSPRPEGTSRYSGQEYPYIKTESRPGSSHLRGLPLTPPTTTDPSFDSYHSPTRKSFSNTSAPAPRHYEATPPLESDFQRYQMQAAGALRSVANSAAAQIPMPVSAPNQSPSGNYYPHIAQTLPPPHAAGVQYQRPLPQSFPPQTVPVTVAPSSGGYVWQHHHYLNPLHGASFPPTQDRYICQTCNKAFSRPSSLRIHSHSHTGEKPFKCPHAACGKAFSVRSNMKRHERGCHGFDVGKGPILIS